MLRAMNDTSPQAQAVMDALLRAASPNDGDGSQLQVRVD
jgi:hypothetical protein